MDYIQIKNLLFCTEYIAWVSDNWKRGMPLCMMVDGDMYDAFLYYLVDQTNGVFVNVKMLILINCRTGVCIVHDGDQVHAKYQLRQNFSYNACQIADVNEYLKLEEKLLAAYLEVREGLLNEGVTSEMISRYYKLLRQMVPSQIVENVYYPLLRKIVF